MTTATFPPKIGSVLGIVSLIVGLAGLLLGLILNPTDGWLVGVPLGTLAVLLGFSGLLVGRSRTGKTLSASGAVVGVLAVVLSWFALRIWFGLEISHVTATELLGAYKEDPRKADAKYRGKWIQVTGKVRDVRREGPGMNVGLPGISVTLESDHKDMTVNMAITSFTGHFGAWEQLKKGQEVTVGGTCTEMKIPQGGLIGRKGSQVWLAQPVLLAL
jgi:hypothetical protein